MGLFFYRFCCLRSTDIATGVSSEQQRKVMSLAEVWHTATFFCSKVNPVDVSMICSQKTCRERERGGGEREREKTHHPHHHHHHTKINMRSVLFWVIMQRIV